MHARRAHAPSSFDQLDIQTSGNGTCGKQHVFKHGLMHLAQVVPCKVQTSGPEQDQGQQSQSKWQFM